MLAEEVPYYKSGKMEPIIAQGGTLWSLILTPANGDMRVAMGEFPAQRGPFVYFNLMEELRQLRGMR